ncbi:hypothetical protein [Bacillus inaquosorum]|uniref:Uncharacterized protein n=1 Tax=Bacillus inaquosorum TaxID=483913 RepID=A0A9Q4EXK4_9BACI|nr:hypothetical protein [Bacillus inaquosorum]MCY9230059.1 hypothetical protein [Bacillus inaquosorum]
MLPTLSIFKEEYIKPIENEHYFIEEINDPSHQLTMQMKVINSSNKVVYRAFCEGDSKPRAKQKEISRLVFIQVQKFPDGIFFILNDDGSVNCFICELKVTPANKLQQLKEQLFSGYIHCKTLFSILDIDKINYNFCVLYIHEDNKQNEFNKTRSGKKVIPGRKIVPDEDYVNWKKGKLLYQEGDYTKEIEIKKMKMAEKMSSFYQYDYVV